MDSLIVLRYRMMADSNRAVLSPVAMVWRYLRSNNPEIELYQADESHPSLAGTYVAACCFYTILFRADPTGITFNPGLAESEAEAIRTTTKLIVFDSLRSWHVGDRDIKARFSVASKENNQVDFTCNVVNATEYQWDFGDGTTSFEQNPTHQYAMSGTYNVRLVVVACERADTAEQTITVTPVGVNNGQSKQYHLYPNPATDIVYIPTMADEPALYKVVSIGANVVMEGMIQHPQQPLRVSQLPKGIYAIEIQTVNGLVRRMWFVKGL